MLTLPLTMNLGAYEIKVTEKTLLDFVGDKYKKLKKYILSIKDMSDNDITNHYLNSEKDVEEEIKYYLELARKGKL